MQAITLYKAQQLIGQLQTLGFPDWQCVPAIMVHGSDLEAAVTYLFEGSVHSEAEARQLLEGTSSLQQIDISPELAQLQQAKVEGNLHLYCEPLSSASALCVKAIPTGLPDFWFGLHSRISKSPYTGFLELLVLCC